MADAKVRVSLKDGLIEIEGDELFVEKQLDAFGELIRAALSRTPKAPLAPDDEPAADKNIKSPAARQPDKNSYPYVFDFTDDKVTVVIERIPGETDKDKMVNASLLCIFGHEALGQQEVSFDALKELCEQHKCLITAKFSQYLKEEGRYFLFGGTPRKQTAKLSVPGRDKAKTLAAELNKPAE
jgi:hypothetical protein